MQLTQDDNLLIQTYMTTAFVLELKNNDFLNSEYYKNVQFQDEFVKKSFPTIGIDNQGMLLITLYTMLVIPKQLLSENYPTEFAELNNTIENLKSNAESTYSSDNSGIDFIRHIRNSVAHAKVEFSQTFSVTFKDENNKGEYCNITIPLSKIGLFITELQKVFMKYVESLKASI
jgi:hypothetical protein